MFVALSKVYTSSIDLFARKLAYSFTPSTTCSVAGVKEDKKRSKSVAKAGKPRYWSYSIDRDTINAINIRLRHLPLSEGLWHYP